MFSNTHVQNIGDAALTVYGVLNRDGAGNPFTFNVEDFDDRYLADVDTLMHDAKRVQRHWIRGRTDPVDLESGLARAERG